MMALSRLTESREEKLRRLAGLAETYRSNPKIPQESSSPDVPYSWSSLFQNQDIYVRKTEDNKYYMIRYIKVLLSVVEEAKILIRSRRWGLTKLPASTEFILIESFVSDSIPQNFIKNKLSVKDPRSKELQRLIERFQEYSSKHIVLPSAQEKEMRYWRASKEIFDKKIFIVVETTEDLLEPLTTLDFQD